MREQNKEIIKQPNNPTKTQPDPVTPGLCSHIRGGPLPFLAWVAAPVTHDFFDLFPAPGVLLRDKSGEGRPFPVTYHVPTASAHFCRRVRLAVPVVPPWVGRRANRLYIIYIYWPSARPTGPTRGVVESTGGEGGPCRLHHTFARSIHARKAYNTCAKCVEHVRAAHV